MVENATAVQQAQDAQKAADRLLLSAHTGIEQLAKVLWDVNPKLALQCDVLADRLIYEFVCPLDDMSIVEQKD